MSTKSAQPLAQTSVAKQAADLMKSMGVPERAFAAGSLDVRSPINGESIGRLSLDNQSVHDALDLAHSAYLEWRKVPAPARGELIRLFAEELRAHKSALAQLVTLEAGKITSEGSGEVQEMIDICSFACGLSRQLYGLTIASERPHHRMMETWHPLGVVGVISAFNFPVAVWAWNAALALVCGNAVIWKPSPKTPLTALAAQTLFDRAATRYGGVPRGLSSILLGGSEVASLLADDPRVPLLSATGSTTMGRALAPRIAARFGRALLELGGNNAAIVCPSADLDLAVRAIAFSAMGTAGQRCTSLRRLIVHQEIYDRLLVRLKGVWASVQVGDPREPGTLVGPLIDASAYDAMERALRQVRAEGGRMVVGGERVVFESASETGASYYVRPALVEMPQQSLIVKRETFAPILYVLKCNDLTHGLELQNGVPQGLSSCIFTRDVREAEVFLSSEGSDCGIANVNIGPSGAEIGGAFGGEKETGGGRESGSDAWKAYMRRATNTVNYGDDLPLAQGVRFDMQDKVEEKA